MSVMMAYYIVRLQFGAHLRAMGLPTRWYRSGRGIW